MTQTISTTTDSGSRYIPVSLSGAAVFDQAIDLLKSNFVPILLIVAVVYLPLLLVEQYIVSAWLNPKFIEMDIQQSGGSLHNAGQMFTLWLEYIPTGYPRYGVPGAVLFIAALVTSAPVSAAVADTVAGRPVSIIDNYRAAWASRKQLFLYLLIAGLCTFAIWALSTALIGGLGFLPIAILTAMAANLSNPSVAAWVVLIYMLVSTVVPLALTCLFFGRTFAFAIPVFVNESASTMDGIARSQQLASCVPLRTTLLTFTLLPLAVISVQLMFTLGCNGVLQLLHFSPVWDYMASTAICALILCVLHAYWMVYITRLYYDYRIKRECLDIRMLMANRLVTDAGK